MYKLIIAVIFLVNSSLSSAQDCPDWLNHTLPKLHSSSSVEICSVIANKPVLLVNTASYCGFTYQFSSLQRLHERYKDKGFVIIGFPSNDFRQEAEDEKKTASICYENYGVEFTMTSPIIVKGDDAHPIFRYLAEKSRAPSWNFNKYLVSADGVSVTHFSTNTDPSDAVFTEAIDKLLSAR